ncbi:hypothetical protein ABZ791_32585 [Streptomyces huasconensis]|uniref:Uncharacterized protein n=1 Tax=Streptomyces huasconensis TaxID=1854574 RepID=A0ABV3M054_9ACTN
MTDQRLPIDAVRRGHARDLRGRGFPEPPKPSATSPLGRIAHPCPPFERPRPFHGKKKEHASITAGGDFDGSVNSDFDLFVRWSYGEVTAYGNTQADAVGREYQLVPPPARAAALARTPHAGRSGAACEAVCGPELWRRGAAH